MTEQAEPFVSVVTPFYNTDQYLSACIDSVLAQSYKNWEYILVNNCSSDRSAEIAQRYAESDPRIRLIHNAEFLNQVQNYNHALSRIDPRSKYCKIVQADDMILPECLSRMVAVAEEHPSVGLVSAYRLCGTTVRREACRTQFIYGGNYFGSPSSILWRSEVIRSRNPFYREDIFFEDTAACFEILKTWDLGLVHQIESWEREDNESISSEIRMYDSCFYLAKFIMIAEFGNFFLQTDQWNETYNAIKRTYFRFLARNILNRRKKEFWRYHIDGMSGVGYRLNFRELLPYVFLEVFEIGVAPLRTIGRIVFFKEKK
jgi:glycosyltransferase involved in cell wall biosynthesis